MKNFKIDTVQVVGLLGGVFAVAGSMLTSYANDKKMENVINDKVAKAIAEQLESIGKGE